MRGETVLLISEILYHLSFIWLKLWVIKTVLRSQIGEAVRMNYIQKDSICGPGLHLPADPALCRSVCDDLLRLHRRVCIKWQLMRSLQTDTVTVHVPDVLESQNAKHQEFGVRKGLLIKEATTKKTGDSAMPQNHTAR